MPLEFRRLARRVAGAGVAVAVAIAAGQALTAQQPNASRQRPAATFRSSVDLVTINVVVRDKDGNIVRGLRREDFAVTEDGQPQTISTFDFEEITNQPIDVVPGAMPTVLGSVGQAPAAGGAVSAEPPAVIDMHGRRLIAMLFDLSSMQPEEAYRAAMAARDYVQKKLTPADMVAITVLSTTLRVVQDFTADRELLLSTIDQMSGVEGQGFEALAAADAADESSTAFSADDSEFALFNTDRRLQAIQALVEAMAPIEQKKSLVYFSSGMDQTGMDNRVAIRTVIDRAVRSNVSIYTADARGLQALGPAGDASQASTRGQSAFSGRAVSNRFDSMAASQDALTSLAEDTGGRAFFDSNEFDAVFDRIVNDTSGYYLLGFTSTNRVQDGRFRRVRVSVRQPGAKLEYRAGYYAPRDFAHSGRDDREQQLMEQLFSDLSVTDLPVYASSGYFRLRGDRYFVPLWIAVPGSKVPFNTSRDKDKATLDILAIVRDGQGRPVARIRDTVNLTLAVTEAVQRKSVQYQTDLELPPGLFTMKVVVRENQTGNMGSFEAAIGVPDLNRVPVRISSVVVGSRLQAAPKKDARNPLMQNGQELIASIAHVVNAGQPLYLYYELYDAARADSTQKPETPTGADAAAVQKAAAQNTTRQAAGVREPVHVMSSVAFFRGTQKVFETALVEATTVSAPDRKATVFQLDVPTTELAPGLYTCQVNLVDDVAGTFAFPRLAVLIRK